MAPQELNLPKDPYVNGQRTEAFLYKNAMECPICFMYYPPHLNKTRCCDQPICSECFVQIKRPEPHPPEHHGEPGDPPLEPQEDGQLVSEPAACPYCQVPEFGVTYESPPFRRGLIFNQQGQTPLGSATSAMSSTSSLNSPTGLTSPTRRRATSLAVNDKTVVTTDMVRPDWAKKLADAKSHALRRAVAATALHNAAYMMGSMQQHDSRFALGRRRRTLFGADSAGSSGVGTPRREREGSGGQNGEGSNDLFPGRGTSRRGNRIDDLEELMMMEAIRLSLAAEEERKRKDEKDAAKDAKKDSKKKAKELKKVAKAQSKIGSGFHPLDIDDGGAGSSAAAGKGKEVDRAGGADFNPMSKPTPTVNTSSLDPQKHLEVSRAQIQRETSSTGNPAPFDPFEDQSHRTVLRNLSNASSSASSLAESYQTGNPTFAPGTSHDPSPNASGADLSQAETPPQGTPGTEPMFNFQSLTEAITPEEEEEEKHKPQHIEDLASANDESEKGTKLEDSTMTLKPEQPNERATDSDGNGMEIEPAPRIEDVSDANGHAHMDQKHLELMGEMRGQATQ